MKRLWHHCWPWLMTLLIGVGLWLLSLVEADWSAWRQATCMPVDCFCEAVRDGFIRQPANAWSNMAFVLVGMLVLRGHGGGGQGAPVLLRDDVVVRLLYATTCVLIGVGSWLYHASLSFAGQWLDVMAMYLFPTCLLLVNLVRAGRIKRRSLLPLWLSVNSALGAMLFFIPLWRRETFVALTVAFIVSEVWARRRLPVTMRNDFLTAAAATIAVAITLWVLDLQHILCSADSLLQGHAAWHVLCSLAAWWIYRYYASEHAVPDAPSHDHEA